MKNYLLKDRKQEKSNQKILRLCDVASRIVLLYGPQSYTEEHINKFWTHKDYISPCESIIRNNISNNHIKWYIGHGHINDYQEIPWNADFLAGLTRYGIVRWCSRRFPSFSWYGNENIIELLKTAPFFGKFNNNVINAPNHKIYIWHAVPALYIPHSEDSISFMAGVLATGQKVEYENETYVKYNRNIGKYLMKWSIPIEFYTNTRNNLYISPIWVSIFIHYMPYMLSYWQRIKNAAKAEEYSALLWRLYINKYPLPDRLPYLQSRRTIYNKFESFKNLERMMVSKNLVNLDSRIGKVVRQRFV